MVTAANASEGDGIARPFHYGNFRTDVPAEPGYSPELISKNVDPKYYNDLSEQPEYNQTGNERSHYTLYDYFEENHKKSATNEPFLGTREQLPDVDGKPAFGNYKWLTYTETEKMVSDFSLGLLKLELCPGIEGESDGKMWRFMGIWSKNRMEWTVSLLSAMKYGITTVGFFDAMSVENVEFIFNQTEMTTVVCTIDYAKKIIAMKDQEQAAHIANLIIMDSFDDAFKSEAESKQVKVYSMQDVMEAGLLKKDVEQPARSKDDVYILSYTSGTTGDSKGVKLTHTNILSNAKCTIPRVPMIPGEIIISYLPYTHSFEQMLLGFALV